MMKSAPTAKALASFKDGRAHMAAVIAAGRPRTSASDAAGQAICDGDKRMGA